MAALAHYNDFGHSLIYIQKAYEVAHFFQDRDIDQALALSLVRSLCYAKREDLIPEFKDYAYVIAKLTKSTLASHSSDDTLQLQKWSVSKSLEWLLNHFDERRVTELYDIILRGNAKNFLLFDMSFQFATNNPVTKNVGWLDFTHAITFSNAVRKTCIKYPHLWAQGLAQMLCFYGRNSKFTNEKVDQEEWIINDRIRFYKTVEDTFFDHGLGAPILSSHLVKTSIATFEEYDISSDTETQKYLLASLNRFLNSEIKEKHVRRIVSQGISLIQHDFKP
jgi:DNA-binding protein Fis